MKNLIYGLGLLMMVFITSCSSQQNVNNFYDKYQGTENSMSFKAPLFLASLMIGNNPEFQALSNKIKSVKVLTINDLDEVKNATVQGEIKNALLKDNFENWFNLNEDGNIINVSAKSGSKALKNLVVSIQGADNLMFITAKTDLTETELTNFITTVLKSDKK